MLFIIIRGFKIKSARLCALAFREHEAHLVIHISLESNDSTKEFRFHGSMEENKNT